jgi:hypothetical protein
VINDENSPREDFRQRADAAGANLLAAQLLHAGDARLAMRSKDGRSVTAKITLMPAPLTAALTALPVADANWVLLPTSLGSFGSPA